MAEIAPEAQGGYVQASALWLCAGPFCSNAVWLCAGLCILLGLPILKLNVVFTAITSICTTGWVGGYAVPIFARMVMAEKNFQGRTFLSGKSCKADLLGGVSMDMLHLGQSFYYQHPIQSSGTFLIMHLSRWVYGWP